MQAGALHTSHRTIAGMTHGHRLGRCLPSISDVENGITIIGGISTSLDGAA
jgi:hypothetical protein